MTPATSTKPAKHGALHYIIAWLALVVLTAVSYAVSRLSLGAPGTALAFGIASIKALIVLVYFMHLADESVSARVVVAVATAFIVLLCLGIYSDVGFR